MSELSSALISAVVAGVVGGVGELRLLGWFVVLCRVLKEISRRGSGGTNRSGAYGVHMDGG